MEFSPIIRTKNIEQMKSQLFDIVVIGGGITGAGIARDAALRGFSVALVEKDDFASGTSSKSARMVHGGFRYLEQFQLGLVMSAASERYTLHKLAPRVVQSATFVFPVFKSSRNSLTKINLGMWFYEFLALFRNVKRHKIMSPSDVKEDEPIISQHQLDGAISYYDCLADDARLTLATIKSAHKYGALIANHLEVTGLLKERGELNAVEVKDKISDQSFSIKTRVITNATGVWVDKLRKMDDPIAENLLRPNRGSHVVFPRNKLSINDVIIFLGIDDKRGMYAVPWGNTVIVGTTDEDHSGEVDRVYAKGSEVQMILISVNKTFPDANLTQDDIISTFAGLRPLMSTGEVQAYQASRDHEIFESSSGLVSIVGGKLTTFRKMAEDMVNHIEKKLIKDYHIHPGSNGDSKQVPIIDQDFNPETELSKLMHRYPKFKQNILTHLVYTYGSDSLKILSNVEEDDSLSRRIVPDRPYILAEIPYAIQYEMAMTLSDFLIRRTHIINESKEQGLDVVSEVAIIMAQFLDWDNENINQQINEFQKQVELSKAYTEEMKNEGNIL